MRRIQAGAAARWTTTIATGENAAGGGGGTMVVETLRAADKQRYIFSLVIDGKRRELDRVIARDGFWYVTDMDKSARYKPFEAPTSVPAFYLALGLSGLQAVSPNDRAKFSRFIESTGDVATYRTPIAESLRPVLTQTLAQWDQMNAQYPGKFDAKLQRQMEALRDMVNNGLLLRVSLSTGIVVESRNPRMDMQTDGFQLLDNVPADAFDIAGTTWKDETDDLSRGRPEDLAMMSHAALWQPGQPSADGNPVLVNLVTGRYRRIPFRGAAAVPGGFLADRKTVALCGTAGGEILRPYLLDLETGETRALGSAAFSGVMAVSAKPSIDGKSIALSTQSLEHGVLSFQLWHVDVATNSASPVGDPMDAGHVNPLLDNSGYVLVTRRTDDMDKPAVSTVSKMDSSGKVTPLIAGDSPCLIGADHATILFEDQQTHQWNICDLAGQHTRRFRDGLAKHGFPSASPDGTRVLMIRFNDKTGPRPVIVPLDPTAKETDVPVDAGLWMMPAWR
jgi:hypothetical protein